MVSRGFWQRRTSQVFMLSKVPKGKPGDAGLTYDTPVKGGIPASANQQGYLEANLGIYGKPINCANGW